jgi:hypothetical protein
MMKMLDNLFRASVVFSVIIAFTGLLSVVLFRVAYSSYQYGYHDAKRECAECVRLEESK